MQLISPDTRIDVMSHPRLLGFVSIAAVVVALVLLVTPGFNRSRLTILDANVTTMIAAVVLLYYGRGPVQGFGVTLAIGIFSSVFCALYVTRLLVELVSSRTDQLRI